jgi:four helix bundle protein
MARRNCDLGASLSLRRAVLLEFSVGLAGALPHGMNPKTIELQARTQRFAANVIVFCEALPKTLACQRIAPQLIDAAGAADSNYRAACRGRSKAEFIAKLGVACEEADESKGWLQLLVKSNQVSGDTAESLIQEADELVSIFAKSRMTAEARKSEEERLARQAGRRSTH